MSRKGYKLSENISADTAQSEAVEAHADGADKAPPASASESPGFEARIAELQNEVDKWKAFSRTWEDRAKENRKASEGSEDLASELSKVKEEFSSYRTAQTNKLFDATVAQLAQKFPGVNVQAFARTINRDTFISPDGDVDAAALEQTLAEIVPAPSVPETPVKPQGLPSSFATKSTTDVKSGGSIESGRAKFAARFNK